MSKACCVCDEAKESKDNVLFNCKGHGCDVTVHQGCYGIVTMPSGLWFCRKCESQERAARVRCELCPKKEGALKRTDSGGWAHVVCALYIPEVTFGNNRYMEPIVTSKLPKERFSKSCYICEEKRKEMQSTYGACMSCHKSSCRLAFHVTCAQKERLLCEEQDSRDSRNIIYCGYCSNHHKKMMRLKNRQSKQQPPPPATSASAPLPTTPTSPSPGCTTPLSAIPPDMSLSEGGSSREAGHPMERTASGSPIKVTTKKERLSLSEVPNQKRPPLPSSSSSTNSEVVLLSGSAPKGKHRKRKPSSSNESTTSEAPSNASDVAMVPPTSSLSGPGAVPNSSPTSLSNHLIPVSPAPLPPPPRSSHKGRRQRDEEEDVGMAGVEGGVAGVEGGVVKMESCSAGDQDDVVQQMIEVSESRGVVPGLPEPKVPAASVSSEQGSRIQAPPPRSLQDLLERQWEQTAQFILDQAGKQNNAGSMLAHLHTLQTENRQMQSRIMELASQREFYLAINTKLRQTISEHDLGRLPNGVQAVDAGAQRHVANSAQEPMEMSGLAHHPQQSHSHLPHGRHHWQPHPTTPPSPQLANSLPREDQESLLHAHFSSSTSLPNLHSSRGTDHTHSSATSETAAQQQGLMGGAGSHPHASNFLSTFTQLPPQATSQGLPAIGPPPPLEDVAIMPSTHGSVEYANRIPTAPSGDTTLHEVTQVTHSIQAPISSLTPLPNDGGCG